MTMTGTDRLIQLLRRAFTDSENRLALIREFQEVVRGDLPIEGAPDTVEVLRDLAYDLDFYVPDPDARAESAAYFGDERAIAEIMGALQRFVREPERATVTIVNIDRRPQDSRRKTPSGSQAG